MEKKYKTFLILKVTLLSFITLAFLSLNSIAAEKASSEYDLLNDLAWQRTDIYIAPDPDIFFQDDKDAGKKLDDLFQAVDKDKRSDDEILATVRQGFRHTTQHKTLILRWIGNKYIWNKEPQNPKAIEIMYHAVPIERHYAVYFGLSVTNNKSPNILRTLADICMRGEDVGRITWGVRSQKDQLVEYIKSYLNDPDPKKQKTASLLLQHFDGEIDFEDYKHQEALEQAKENFGDQLPELRHKLLTGDSKARLSAIKTINSNNLAELMDDSFLAAMQAAANDSDSEVRKNIATLTGSRWIWGKQPQNSQAIELMLKLADDIHRSVRSNAVYYGLSIVRNKSKEIIRQLIEMALVDHENNYYGRITWGLHGAIENYDELFENILAEYLERAKSNTHLAASIYSLYKDVLEKEPPSQWNLGYIKEHYPDDLYMIDMTVKKQINPNNSIQQYNDFINSLPENISIRDKRIYTSTTPVTCLIHIRTKEQADLVALLIENNPDLTFGQIKPIPLQLQLYYNDSSSVSINPNLQKILNNMQTLNPLQQKIDQASPGDTINIGPGTFQGYLLIDKPLTIIGVGWDKTTIILDIDFNKLFQELEDVLRLNNDNLPTSSKEFIEEMKAKLIQPLLLINNTQDVTIQGIRISIPGKTTGESLLSLSALKINNSKAHLTRCAVLGILGNGIQIVNNSDVQIDNTLVAAAWSTGIVIGERSTKPSKVTIQDSDIRNCYYAGIIIGSGNNDITITKCRISGAAWHGLCYDDASPQINDNLFFGNARMGIYASGKTRAKVLNNLFYDNDMSGMACWFENRDLIEANTFIQNKRVGMTILGKSKPTVIKNIYFDNPIGIAAGSINDNGNIINFDGNVSLQDNLFWENEDDTQWRKSTDPKVQDNSPLTHQSGPIQIDPQFKSIAEKDFSLTADSPARKLGIGANNLIHLQGPWPIQPEETAIIPDGDTRDYNKWKTVR